MAPRRTAPALLLALTLLGGAACGDDSDDRDGGDGAEVEETTTTTTGGDGGGPEGEDAAALPEDVCLLLGDDAAERTGLALAGGQPGGDGVRRVCTFAPADNDGVGITIGVQGGSRFDDKAETSEAALGPGEPVDDLGDEALSFYDDVDIPEGVGGTLVAVGDLTVDVSVQGVRDEAATREAATALARLVVDAL